jgi:hypothetical protein
LQLPPSQGCRADEVDAERAKIGAVARVFAIHQHVVRLRHADTLATGDVAQLVGFAPRAQQTPLVQRFDRHSSPVRHDEPLSKPPGEPTLRKACRLSERRAAIMTSACHP